MRRAGATWCSLAASPVAARQWSSALIAVPGDLVELDDGVLVVNGTPEREGALSNGSGSWALGDDEWFLLGDAMDFSTDSRAFGPVPRRTIEARAWLVCWPLARWRRLDGEGRDD